MRALLPSCRQLALLTPLLLLAGTSAAQVPGVSREQMWWAPTQEDWQRPCLITWQRSWDDAVTVSKETGKPILVCVNMDGEIASEHYAGVRYRMPEIATIYEPYVTVIASVYRHNPRDYDQEGRRILCPRFGSVTCGEHISIEPILYEQFLDGRRIAPRHIMVELDGQETYDVFYAFDTDSVFAAVEDGIANRPDVPIPVDVPERTLVERVTSRSIEDRVEVESAYQAGDRDTRRILVRAAAAAGEDTPVDLLRLAVFDLDVELNRLALRALARADSEGAVRLIAEALHGPMDPADRDALIAALERLGEKYPHASTLAAVHRGLTARSEAVDLEGWSTALEGSETVATTADRAALEYQLENKARLTSAQPEDAGSLLEYAEATLALAVDPETAVVLSADRKSGSDYAQLMFEDVRRSALRAEKLGATGWRIDCAIAVAAFYLGDVEQANTRAAAAVDGMPAGEQGWSAMAALAIFAQARQQAIQLAVREKREWPRQWLTDVTAAYSVLARHPLGTDAQVVAHFDFLRSLGAGGRAGKVLDEGLRRFPDSWELHARLRGRILWEKGVAGLETTYEEKLREDGASPNLEWYAGYASIVAAEFHRRTASEQEALAAYDRSIAHFERFVAARPDDRATADHYVALAHAGRARVALEREDYDTALSELLASFDREPDAAASLDGLGLSPVATARTLQARLSEAERTEQVAQLQSALDALDPDLLLPPAFERVGPAPSGRPRDRGRRGRGRQGG